MKTLIYISEYLPSSKETKQVLKDIIRTSVKNNQLSSITGVLLFHNNHFLQVLEGEEKSIADTLERIKQDTRHKNIEILYHQDIDKRNYPNWKMELFDISDVSKFNKPVLKKIKELYDHNFQFNSENFLFLVKSLLNDQDFLDELNS